MSVCHFHFQSDIVHQSVYELVHSEDREELQRQLMWNAFLPPESSNMSLQEVLLPENCYLLERSFTVRFRCLLDNTSGFLVSIKPNLQSNVDDILATGLIKTKIYLKEKKCQFILQYSFKKSIWGFQI